MVPLPIKDYFGSPLFLSNPKDWYVISHKRVCNRRRRMLSRFSVYFLRIDYIHFFEMITYRNKLRITFKALP